MGAGKYNFTIEQGATVDFAVNYKDSSNTAVDLSGYDARMQIRPTKDSDTVHITLSSSLNACYTGLNLSGSGGHAANTSPTEGSIGVFISAESSSLLDFNTAFYDLEVVSGSGNCAVVTRLIEGTVTLSKEVTKGSY